MSNIHWPQHPRDWCTIALGGVIALLGLPMALLGADLIALGGSWYYAPCGLLVLIAGILIFLGRSLGATAYLLAWVGTALWSFWEVGFDGWGLLPRLFGPTILAVLVLLIIPTLKKQERARAAQHATSHSGAAV